MWQENPFKEALPQKHDIPINVARAPIDKTALVQGQINKAWAELSSTGQDRERELANSLLLFL